MRSAVLVVALFLGSCALAATNDVAQCWAATESGNRCKRRAAANERYCKQHSAAQTMKKTPEKCRSFAADGKPCEARPVAGKRYCAKHLNHTLQSAGRAN